MQSAECCLALLSEQGAYAQVFFCFALITNLIVSALLVLGGSAVITAVTGMSQASSW